MKVRVQNNIDISDEQRVALAQKIDGPGAKKRQATREEIQDFVWGQGSQWADYLIPVDDAEEDLIGEDLIGSTDDGADLL